MNRRLLPLLLLALALPASTAAVSAATCAADFCIFGL
jgi:hypothetical protein